MSKKTIIILVIVIVAVIIAAYFGYVYFVKDRKVELTDEEFKQVITSFDPDNLESYEAIENVIEKNGKKAVPVVAKYVEDDNIYNRYISIYILSRVACKKDISELEKALTDSNLSLKTIAAGALVRLGDKKGIPVLIESAKTDTNKLILFSLPPVTISDYSLLILSEYIDEDFGYKIGLTDSERQNVISSYENWWSENKDSVKWNSWKKKFK